MVWCGARNGRSVSRPTPGRSWPATEWIVVASIDSSNDSGGRIPAVAARASFCPRPAGRSSGGCGRRPRRLRARVARRPVHEGRRDRQVPGVPVPECAMRTAVKCAVRPLGVCLVQSLDGLTERSHRQQPQAADHVLRRDCRCGSSKARAWLRRASAAIGSTPRAGWIDPSSDNSPTCTMPAKSVRLTTARRGQHADGDRQIECGTGLAHIAGRKVDGDSRQRELETRIPHRGADAIAALLDARIGQADQLKRREAAADVDLDVHAARVDADHGRALDRCEHARPVAIGLPRAGVQNRPLFVDGHETRPEKIAEIAA